MKTARMDPDQKRLKDARAEIEAVLKRYDIAGFVSLHGPNWGEVFWNLWPTYSILTGDFPAIRIKSKAADYRGDTSKQISDQAQSAQMVHHLATSMGGCAVQFLELAGIINAAVRAEHVDRGFEPDPSKANPGAH